MKKIVLIPIVLFTFVLTSCNIGPKTNSYDCKYRYDVQLLDGSAIWVYSGRITSCYIKGNDESGNDIWIPMCNTSSITKLDCGNAN